MIPCSSFPKPGLSVTRYQATASGGLIKLFIPCNALRFSSVIIIEMSRFNEKEIKVIEAAKACVIAHVKCRIFSFYEILDQIAALIPIRKAWIYLQEGYLLALKDAHLSEAKKKQMDDAWFVRKATPASYFRSGRVRHDAFDQAQAA